MARARSSSMSGSRFSGRRRIDPRDGHRDAWKLLGLGPLDANIRIGPPVPLDSFPDRKALARYAEEKVRNDVIELLRGRPAANGTASAKACEA